MGISNQVSIMASKVSIKKCKDVQLPVDTSNDIYKLKTGFIKENHYLIVPKDCDIYLQMHENETISFKTIRKVNKTRHSYDSYEDQYILNLLLYIVKK